MATGGWGYTPNPFAQGAPSAPANNDDEAPVRKSRDSAAAQCARVHACSPGVDSAGGVAAQLFEQLTAPTAAH